MHGALVPQVNGYEEDITFDVREEKYISGVIHLSNDLCLHCWK